ncbi:MAG: hypothetical protein CSA07_00570 [Bacteroidia bacterium]|nr:MAG: hypothetical protein CSA07_00570 [Bacteroidia bacterium]
MSMEEGFGMPMPPRTDPALGIQWVRVEGGRFLMGSPADEEGRGDDEWQHEVKLSGFWMSATVVTNAQYNAFLKAMEAKGGGVWKRVGRSGSAYNLNTNSGYFYEGAQPVVGVTWDDAMAFCEWVGNGVTLPTEAQWEYACRAGSKAAYGMGADGVQVNGFNLGDYAWYDKNAGRRTHAVGKKRANAFGLYDMHGNVWEWCSDWYARYEDSPKRNPLGPMDGTDRVVRGGSWGDGPRVCRCASRGRMDPMDRVIFLGFRLVAPLEP